MANELVLIVDDNAKNAKLARDVLRLAGFRTLEAGSGGEAARRLKDDIRTAGIPVVALTSLTANEKSFREAGFDGYLEKPISVAEFPEQVRDYCR